MATALDTIKASLRLLQVLGPDVVLTADEESNALEALNGLLDSWSNESLTVYQVTQEVFSLTPGHNPHTWGIGGNLNSLRPTQLLQASMRFTSGNVLDLPIRIIGYDDYSQVRIKALQSQYPQYLYIDSGYPLANVYLHPIPSDTLSLLTYSNKPHSSPVLANTELTFPPGYFRAMKYALAMELAPEYQISAGNDIAALATSSLAAIKRTNKKLTTLSLDPAVLGYGQGGGRYNIYTDT